ncbi:hypothetical protein L2E82_29559 [Cichorium intybus]|uniref:Uncharacterized protein n=1 Tax=Cichorium intybus TaxID=13427 RepID=A0ACB9CXV0_CICIN|nr:hypothetical protein L2E82_29559 [Cichorium intybus]
MGADSEKTLCVDGNLSGELKKSKRIYELKIPTATCDEDAVRVTRDQYVELNHCHRPNKDEVGLWSDKAQESSKVAQHKEKQFVQQEKELAEVEAQLGNYADILEKELSEAQSLNNKKSEDVIDENKRKGPGLEVAK